MSSTSPGFVDFRAVRCSATPTAPTHPVSRLPSTMSPPIRKVEPVTSGHVHRFANGRDAGGIIEDLRHVAVIGDMDVGEEHDGFCPHDVRVAERGTGHMEAWQGTGSPRAWSASRPPCR